MLSLTMDGSILVPASIKFGSLMRRVVLADSKAFGLSLSLEGEQVCDPHLEQPPFPSIEPQLCLSFDPLDFAHCFNENSPSRASGPG